MTPREKLENLLSASDVALQLMILRSTNNGPQFLYAPAERKIRDVFSRNVIQMQAGGYFPTLEAWGYKADWFPICGFERDVVQHYPTVEALIQEAFSLGFLDQAIRCSQAWEKAKK